MKSLYSEARDHEINISPPERALTIGAHPDDAEFGAGGTLAWWAEAGCEITMLVMTDGSKGTWDPALQSSDLAHARRREQEEAADRLGASRVVMLEHVDGELETTMELRRELALWIRKIRPDVVLTHDPWQRYQLHPDHRATGFSAIDAVVAARDHLFFPEQLVDGVGKHRPTWILLWSADEPNHWVNIEQYLDHKVAALLEHSSQGQTTMADAQSSSDAAADFRRRIESWAHRVGRPADLELAEAFRAIKP